MKQDSTKTDKVVRVGFNSKAIAEKVNAARREFGLSEEKIEIRADVAFKFGTNIAVTYALLQEIIEIAKNNPVHYKSVYLNGKCFAKVSVGALRELTGFTEKSIMRHIKVLEDSGLLIVHRNCAEGEESNSYAINDERLDEVWKEFESTSAGKTYVEWRESKEGVEKCMGLSDKVFTEKARYMWLKVIAEERPDGNGIFDVCVAENKWCRKHKTDLREFEDFKPHYYNIRECPFCGGDAELVKSGREGSAYVLVECGECKARGKGFYVGSELDGRRNPERSEMAELAIRAWNKRVKLV